MQSIMGGEIAYTFRRSDRGIDRTTKSDDGLFRFPAISQFGYAPDDLLFICPLSQVFSYHLKTQTSGTLLRFNLKRLPC
jgi:hypothetical protein